MRKYTDIQDGRKFTKMDLALIQQAIANELAEANRLKRIELRLKITELNYTMEPVEHDDEEKFQPLMTDAEADSFEKQLEESS